VLSTYRSTISRKSIGDSGLSSAFVVLNNLRALFCGVPSVANVCSDVSVCERKAWSGALTPIVGIPDGISEAILEGIPEGIPLSSILIVGATDCDGLKDGMAEGAVVGDIITADGLKDGVAEGAVVGDIITADGLKDGMAEGAVVGDIITTGCDNGFAVEGENEGIGVAALDDGEIDGIGDVGLDDGEGVLIGWSGSVGGSVGDKLACREGLGVVGVEAVGRTNTLRSLGSLLCLLSRARKVSSLLSSQRLRTRSPSLFRNRRRNN
jgi:hypothetical protein